MFGVTLAAFFLCSLLRVNGRIFSFGRTDGGYFDLPARWAESVTDCLKKQCGVSAGCSVAFIEEVQGRCFRLKFPSQILLWNIEVLVEDYSWQTYVNLPQPQVDKRPAVLWLFDKFTAGKNYGIRGSKLDISVANLTFEDSGPKATADITYAKISAGISQKSVNLLNKGVAPIVFKKPFTLAMWLRTVAGVPGGKPYILISGSPRRLLELNNARNQLTLCVRSDVCVNTARNSTKLNQWRHVAVVYQSRDDVRFYLEGSAWPAVGKMPFNAAKNDNQGVLRMFESFSGSMTCVAIFEAALEQREIQIVRQNCP